VLHLRGHARRRGHVLGRQRQPGDHPARRPMMTSLRCIAIGLGLAAASCRGDGTSLRLHVAYDASWGLDTFRLQAHDVKSDAAVAEVVTVRVPDSWAGEAVALELWGLRGGEARAHGTASAMPVKGAAVDVDLALAAVPCGAWCTLGATRCA